MLQGTPLLPPPLRLAAAAAAAVSLIS